MEASARLLTARAVATRLSVSTETVLRWTRRGALPGFRLPGGALRYREDELDAWLRDRTTTAQASDGAPVIRVPSRPTQELSPNGHGHGQTEDEHATNPARPGVQAELW